MTEEDLLQAVTGIQLESGAREETGRSRDVKRCVATGNRTRVSGISLNAITARPPQHDTTGPRHRAFDVFQSSCFTSNPVPALYFNGLFFFQRKSRKRILPPVGTALRPALALLHRPPHEFGLGWISPKMVSLEEVSATLPWQWEKEMSSGVEWVFPPCLTVFAGLMDSSWLKQRLALSLLVG